ncbi:MAG UNVERIFIED_CONTAM: hypothetical protein LVR18_18105 [Planctomycetaceae bacterium]
MVSAGLLADRAEQAGMRIQRGVAGMPTAFVAEFGEGRPVIGILGEYDALPGLSQQAEPEPLKRDDQHNWGHGCGHHLFGTASLSAAIAVAEQDWGRESSNRQVLRMSGGRGRFGQGVSGSGRAVSGCRCGASLASVIPNFGWRSVIAGTNRRKVSLRGQDGAMQQEAGTGRSALDAVELTAHASELLREHTPEETRIHHVITSGGEAPNVVPAFAEMYFYIRHPEARFLKPLYERLEKCAAGRCSGHRNETDCSI